MDPLHDPINGGLVPLRQCLEGLQSGIARIIELQGSASPKEMLQRLNDASIYIEDIKKHPELSS